MYTRIILAYMRVSVFYLTSHLYVFISISYTQPVPNIRVTKVSPNLVVAAGLRLGTDQAAIGILTWQPWVAANYTGSWWQPTPWAAGMKG